MLLRLCVVFLLATSTVWAMGQMPSQDRVMVQAPAADFTLPMISGKTQSLSAVRGGQKALMFFWATWCPHCREEIAHLNDAILALKEKGIVIVLVDVGETPEEAKAFLESKNITLDSFVDEDNTLQEPYQLIGVPTVVAINAAGNITYTSHEMPQDLDSIF